MTTKKINEDVGKILNPFEHALLRPDKYIGSKITTHKKEWVYDEDTKSMIYREIIYNPGLIHLFIEVSSNAIDNVFRSLSMNVKMTKIQFTIDLDPESETFGWITVLNDGCPIPAKSTIYTLEGGVKEEMYPVQAFFTKMLAGTNFENDKTRKSSGRNGIGAKTMVIFSKKCIIEHTDPNNRKKVVLEVSDNGKNKGTPKVTSFSGVNGYTKVSFLPDYEYFDFDIEDETTQNDYLGILKKLAYDCAMITKLNVSFNGEKLKVDSLLKYAKLFYPDTKFQTIASGLPTNLINSECVVCEKTVETDVEGLEKFSWINGIFTAQGGIHVDAYTQKIIVGVVKLFNEKNSKGKNPLKTTSANINPHLAIFVRAEAPGPNWEGNNKEKLFGIYDAAVGKSTDKYPLKLDKDDLDSLIDKIYKWDFVKDLKENLIGKKDDAIDKKSKLGNKRVKLGDKGRDANYAGKGDKSSQCILFITEGDSARGFAERLCNKLPGGLDVYGSLAIRGKIINTVKASKADMEKNVEVKMIRELLGLEYGVNYSTVINRKKLRYGTVMIMSDQDDDGFHIRGLIMSFLYSNWPTLFTSDPLSIGKTFVQSFTTAVVMIKENPKATPMMFFSNPEFKKYMETHRGIAASKIKYYKGLGTHDKNDHLHYLNPKVLEYIPDSKATESLDIWFSDKKYNGIDCVTHRKRRMLARLPKPEFMDDQSESVAAISEEEDIIDEDNFKSFGKIGISEFCSDQLMIFNLRTIQRALPNIYDGFKDGQRKIFYGMSRSKKSSTKVTILAGEITKVSSYHHGEASLHSTIIKMAQSFTGSNNIPVLLDDGNYGSRAAGGSDAAGARYIFSKIRDIANTIYHEDDIPILEKNLEEGKMIGYKYYIPILPMLLINGAEGIATGWSTTIPLYNPLDLVEWIKEWLDLENRDEDSPNIEALTPWYIGFKGKIELKDIDSDGYAKNWESTGIINPSTTKKGWYDITELPVGTNKLAKKWTNDIISYFEEISDSSAKDKNGNSIQQLKDYEIISNEDNNIHIRVLPLETCQPNINDPKNFASKLKITNSLNNMYAIDENGYPTKYSCVEHILDDFCNKRLEFYKKRKSYLLKKFLYEKEKAKNKYRFIQEVIDSKFIINRHKTEESLEEALQEAGYKKFTNTFIRPEEQNEIILEDDEEDIEQTEVKKGGKNPTYNYLLNIPVRTQTQFSVNKLKNESLEAEKAYNILNDKSPERIWKEDLEKFKIEYAKFLEDIERSDETTDNKTVKVDKKVKSKK